MKVWGSLDVAGLEQLAANPTAGLFQGRLYWNTVDLEVRVYNGTEWKSIGGGGLQTALSSSAATMEPQIHYLTDTSAASYTLTLPAGEEAAVIRVSDVDANWSTNNLTIATTGAETINGDATLVCDIDHAWVQFMWNGTEWKTDDNLDRTELLSARRVLWQKKDLGSNISTNNTDFLTFNNLTVGQTYRFTGTVTLSGITSAYHEVHIKEASNIINALIFQNSNSGTVQCASGFTVIFEATGTTCTLTTNNLGGTEVIRAADVTGEVGTFAILEQLNEYTSTTDWT